jgi:hypothetical protein
MTTPTVTELIRNGNPVEERIEPAPRVAPHLRLASPPAERTPSLPLAA